MSYRPSRLPSRPKRTARSAFARVCLCLATVGPLGATLSAQQPPTTTIVEEEIVVSANRAPVPAERIGSAVTVITAEEIERRGSLTLTELLRTVPGVEMTQTGGPGKATSVRIRGGDASQALVLIDGVRVNSPTTGDLDFSNLRTDLIERIEILRGPQATYGSEAVTGVISITTRRGREGAQIDLSAESGSDNLAVLSVAVLGRSGHFDYALSASDYQTDGVSHRAESLGNTEKDPYQNQTFVGRFGWIFDHSTSDKKARLDLAIRSYDGDTDLDGFFGDDLNATQETRSLQTALTFDGQLTRRVRQTLSVGVHDSDLLGEDPDTFFNNYRIDTRVSHFYSQSDFDLADGQTLTVGYRFEDREATNVGAFDESVDLQSLFLQHQLSWRERVHLTAALRRDDHSVFGGETTWRATAAVLLGSATRLHGSAGTSFRAPDFNELYFPGAGDATLLPETSTGFDLGIDQTLLGGRLTFDVTYFDSDFDDLIDFDLASFRFANVSRASSSGVEAVLEANPGRRLHLTLAHTYNDAEDRATGIALARRPRNRSSLDIGFDPHPRLHGSFTVIAVSDRIESTGQAMDDYERADVTVRFDLTSTLQPFFRVENLLDEDYEEIPGFTTPDRVVAIGLRYRR